MCWAVLQSPTVRSLVFTLRFIVCFQADFSVSRGQFNEPRCVMERMAAQMALIRFSFIVQETLNTFLMVSRISNTD